MKMNRAAFLTTLAGGALALPGATAAETAVEKAIYDLLDAATDAEFTYDFPRLAVLLHPSAKQLFRNILAARFDQLLKSYSLEQIVSVSGLAGHPKDLTASDDAIFIAACQSAGKRHPEFVGDARFLPLKIHGTIFDSNRLAHVLFSYSGDIHTERTDFDFSMPMILTVCRAQEKWQVRSCLLARRIIDDWWRDLAKLKEPAPRSK